jgi:hypothetical protein
MGKEDAPCLGQLLLLIGNLLGLVSDEGLLDGLVAGLPGLSLLQRILGGGTDERERAEDHHLHEGAGDHLSDVIRGHAEHATGVVVGKVEGIRVGHFDDVIFGGHFVSPLLGSHYRGCFSCGWSIHILGVT